VIKIDQHISEQGPNLTLISVDGVDGTGKSTLAEILGDRIPQCKLIPEFSDTELGKFLKACVSISPHFIAESELAQSLLFLAEYADRIHSADRGRSQYPIQIVERGWLSKYAYQACVLERVMTSAQARSLVSEILRAGPQPDSAILLRASEQTIRERVHDRNIVIDSDFIGFLERADQLMLGLVDAGYPALIIDTSFRTPEEVASIAIPYIQSRMNSE
jgi:thymidylate kinase